MQLMSIGRNQSASYLGPEQIDDTESPERVRLTGKKNPGWLFTVMGAVHRDHGRFKPQCRDDVIRRARLSIIAEGN